MKSIQDLRLAFIGVSHWHVPLYLLQVQRDKLNVVAASDPEAGVADRFARQHSCTPYTDAQRLLDEVAPDFVFAFAPHDIMPSLALDLIDRGIPFAIEKPLGLSATDVETVCLAAKKAEAFCAIPFVWRYSQFIDNFKQTVPASDIQHLAFRFIAGPPSRYLGISPWMLEAKRCGGGCMTNLGVHFIDMALNLAGATEAEVIGAAYQYGSDYDIETYASALVRLAGGATMSLETGYAYPMDSMSARDNRWNIATSNGYYTLGDNLLEQRRYGMEPERIPMSTDSDVYYAEFACITLEDYLNGRTPRAGLPEMLQVRRILDSINQTAQDERNR